MKKINYIEIKDLDEIEYDLNKINYDHFVHPLFHGTRMAALECTSDEIEKMQQCSREIIDFILKVFFEERTIAFSEVESYQEKNPKSYFVSAVLTQLKISTLYEYGDLYMSTQFSEAADYARYGCGELCQMGYDNAVGIIENNIKGYSSETKNAIDYLIENYPKFLNSEKAVLVYENIKFSDLYFERGGPYVEEDENYTKENIDDLYRDYCDSCCYYTLRLKGKEDCYTPKLVKESLFNKALKKFNKKQ